MRRRSPCWPYVKESRNRGNPSVVDSPTLLFWLESMKLDLVVDDNGRVDKIDQWRKVDKFSSDSVDRMMEN